MDPEVEVFRAIVVLLIIKVPAFSMAAPPPAIFFAIVLLLIIAVPAATQMPPPVPPIPPLRLAAFPLIVVLIIVSLLPLLKMPPPPRAHNLVCDEQSRETMFAETVLLRMYSVAPVWLDIPAPVLKQYRAQPG